ncbi:hypothetical protein ACTXMB_14540 [Arthrobacter rhombi]|uniref:hypothetical protein n=1 Tax=Arthrobacter rhombi TaxID=71253 RepID=UPI003FD14D8D
MDMNDQTQVTRFFQVSRVPIMFGRLPSGERIWGGPYTGAQLMTAFASLFIGIKTMNLWGTGSFLASLVILAMFIGGAVYVAGRLRSVRGNPLVLVEGWGRSMVAPKTGTYRGAKVFLPTPKRSGCHRILINNPATARRPVFRTEVVVATAPEGVADPVARISTTQHTPVAGSSAVQHLLAQLNATN